MSIVQLPATAGARDGPDPTQCAELAAYLFKAPCALISLRSHGEPRSWSWVAQGHALPPGSGQLCEEVAQSRRATFRSGTTPGIAFFAGVPLPGLAPSVQAAICVFDNRTRRLGKSSVRALEGIAALAARSLLQPGSSAAAIAKGEVPPGARISFSHDLGGKLLEWNSGFLELSGRRPSDLSGCPLPAIAAQGSAATPAEWTAELLAGAAAAARTFQLTTGQGETVTLQVNPQLQFQRGKPAQISVAASVVYSGCAIKLKKNKEENSRA